MTEQAPEKKKKIEYCEDCRRIKGVGCDCGLSFQEKMRGISLTVPLGFGYRGSSA